MKKRWSMASSAAACLAVLLGTLAFAAASDPDPPPGQGIHPLGLPSLVVKGSSGQAQGWITLRNSGEAISPVFMTLGPFVSATTGRAMATEAMFFLGDESAGRPYVESNLEAGKTLRCRLVVSNLSEPGESTATLFINDAEHPLRAVNIDVPFNVGLQSETPEKPALTLLRHREGLMVLKNDDPGPYAVTWWLAIPNEPSVLEGTAVLPPKGSRPVVFDPPAAWFVGSFEGLFKDKERSAWLNIAFTPGGRPSVGPEGPAATLPVQLRLSYWPEGTKKLWSNLILLGLLALGGVCSLVLGMWIPNKLKSIELHRRLDELARMTRPISRKTDSTLRVGVRVERLRQWELVRGLGLLNADAGERLKRLEQDVDLLATRIELVALLDAVAQRLEALRRKTSGAPPELLQRAARSLDEATRILKLAHPTASDFQNARTCIQSADTILDRLGETNAELAGKLAAQIKQLRAEYDTAKGSIGSRPTCLRLRRKLTDLFEVLRDATYEDPAQITVDRIHWVNISIEKLFVLTHYIIRHDDTQADPTRHERVKACEEKLVRMLRLQSPYTLELARNIREEIEQDIFTPDLCNELKGNRFTIKKEPLTARPNEPVRLWVEFNDPRFNHCAALKNFRCVWNFTQEVGQEQGWEITHYFRNPAEASYELEIHMADGTVAASKKEEQRLSQPEQALSGWRKWVGPGKWLSDQGKVETGRLLLALFIAVLALVGGAREQLMKLDVFPGLVAVFLLGFGADTVKSLFTRRT